LKNVDCDFVVLAALNRGYRFGKAKGVGVAKGKEPPRFYCFPIDLVKTVRRLEGWNKVHIKKIADLHQYENAWHLIRNFVG